MISSFFLLEQDGHTLLSKHYKKATSEHLLYEIASKLEIEGQPPILEVNGTVFAWIHPGPQVFAVATVTRDIPAICAIQLLHNIIEMFQHYIDFKYGGLTPKMVKRDIVVLQQVVDEIADGGLPFNNYPAAMKSMVYEESIIGQLNPWTSNDNDEVARNINQLMQRHRPTGVYYARNELLVDFVEYIDAKIDGNKVLYATIRGLAKVECRLSGMPEICFMFSNHRIIDDAALHPSVNKKRYLEAGTLSLIPPDKKFTVFEYTVRGNIKVPVNIKVQSTYSQTGGTLHIRVDKNVGQVFFNSVKLDVIFPTKVTSADFTVSHGFAKYNEQERTATWKFSHFPAIAPTLDAKLTCSSQPEMKPVVVVSFELKKWNASGLNVDQIKILNVDYKPFKGVKHITKAGEFEVRH